MGFPTAPESDDRIVHLPLREILELSRSQDINQLYQEWAVILYMSMPRSFSLHGFWNEKDCANFVTSAKKLPSQDGTGWKVKYVLQRGKPLDLYLKEKET